MEYSEIIKNQIEIIDQTLFKLGLPPLFENKDFQTDDILNAEQYLTVRYKYSGRIEFYFIITNFGMDLFVDGFEIYSIEVDKQKIQEMVRLVFCSKIVVKKCNGNKYIKIYFYDINKKNIMTATHLGSIIPIFIKTKCNVKEYEPIISFKEIKNYANIR